MTNILPLSLTQDIMSYKFVDKIRKQIEVCSGDIVVTEPDSGGELIILFVRTLGIILF